MYNRYHDEYHELQLKVKGITTSYTTSVSLPALRRTGYLNHVDIIFPTMWQTVYQVSKDLTSGVLHTSLVIGGYYTGQVSLKARLIADLSNRFSGGAVSESIRYYIDATGRPHYSAPYSAYCRI